MGEEQKTASEMVREKAGEINRSKESLDIRAAQQATANANWGKGVTDAQRAALEHIARELGLSTPMGHLIYLGGQVYITAKGHVALAHKQGVLFQGFDEEALPKSEWEQWGVANDAEAAWICRVHRAGIERPFVEVGWAGGKREANQPVARQFPAEMARKRARCRALDLAFPAPIPSYEEVALGGVAIPDEIWQRVEQQQKAPTGPSAREILKKAAEFDVSEAMVRQQWERMFPGGTMINATAEQFRDFVDWCIEYQNKTARAQQEQRVVVAAADEPEDMLNEQ